MCGFRKESAEQCLLQMQNEVDNIKNLCATNNLSLNDSKTVSLTIYSTKRFIPPFKDSSGANMENSALRFLGVYFDSKLSRSAHVDYFIKKCSLQLHILRLLRRYLAHKELISVYFAPITSITECVCHGSGCMPHFSTIGTVAHSVFEWFLRSS